MLSLHLLDPLNASLPRGIAAFEADVHRSAADNALDTNVDFSLLPVIRSRSKRRCAEAFERSIRNSRENGESCQLGLSFLGRTPIVRSIRP
jgi:hypothetical protein